MKILYHIAAHWKEIAERLGFTEEDIDEIFTNNDPDAECLRDVLDRWNNWVGNWQKLAQVLNDMGEDSLARQVGGDGECSVTIHTDRQNSDSCNRGLGTIDIQNHGRH